MVKCEPQGSCTAFNLTGNPGKPGKPRQTFASPGPEQGPERHEKRPQQSLLSATARTRPAHAKQHRPAGRKTAEGETA